MERASGCPWQPGLSVPVVFSGKTPEHRPSPRCPPVLCQTRQRPVAIPPPSMDPRDLPEGPRVGISVLTTSAWLETPPWDHSSGSSANAPLPALPAPQTATTAARVLPLAVLQGNPSTPGLQQGSGGWEVGQGLQEGGSWVCTLPPAVAVLGHCSVCY